MRLVESFNCCRAIVMEGTRKKVGGRAIVDGVDAPLARVSPTTPPCHHNTRSSKLIVDYAHAEMAVH